MTAKELSSINTVIRKMITDHMTKNGMTIASFSRESGVHQSQLWMYLNTPGNKKGLHSSTIEKIGKYLHKNT
jgi:lambda repressor-like predicted transcriptional regulator